MLLQLHAREVMPIGMVVAILFLRGKQLFSFCIRDLLFRSEYMFDIIKLDQKLWFSEVKSPKRELTTNIFIERTFTLQNVEIFIFISAD